MSLQLSILGIFPGATGILVITGKYILWNSFQKIKRIHISVHSDQSHYLILYYKAIVYFRGIGKKMIL